MVGRKDVFQSMDQKFFKRFAVRAVAQLWAVQEMSCLGPFYRRMNF